jgi:hypothetical protein
MAMGKRKRVRATELWIPTTDLPLASSHPFYRRLKEVLRLGDVDTFVERACQKFMRRGWDGPVCHRPCTSGCR